MFLRLVVSTSESQKDVGDMPRYYVAILTRAQLFHDSSFV